MKCPCCAKSNLVELKENSKDYSRGFNYKCMKCKKFFSIIGEDF